MARDVPVDVTGQVVHLRADGVGLVLDLTHGRLPDIVHWGQDLGALDDAALRDLLRSATAPQASNGIDSLVRVALLPESSTGWTGAPGLSGHRAGQAWSTAFQVVHATAELPGAGGRVVVDASDRDAALDLRLEVELDPVGVLRVRATVTNRCSEAYTVDELLPVLPVPVHADEILDLAGRWGKERVPQRRPFTVGSHVREGRHGRTGADAAFVTALGPAGFGFGSGEVWAVHVAWSGNHRTRAERVFTGERVVGGGELLLPGEVVLGEGQTYTSPWLYGVHGVGLDAAADRFHRRLRARPQHPRTPRPVTLNVWEAVYFDHDLDRLRSLADLGAQVGVERFVLDDGWFRHRRDDTAGLGDWYVDEDVWPDGLAPLVEHVHARGMQFGLWVEPEMVNPDSDLARAHPDWLLQVPGRLPVAARHQQVLDVADPGVFAYLHDRLTTLVHELGIDYLKWDHNRDLVDAGARGTGRPGVHAQTLAVYRLLDEVRRDCPGLEIESCSSGGARIDLEILERTDRVWASDCIDALERQQIQRWTAQLLPPELVGAHVGAERAHTTGRRHDLSFRAGTALFASFGIEWDLGAAAPGELAELAAWIEVYKTHRALLHGGRTVRADLPEETGVWVHGVVAPDRTEALYSVVVRDRPVTWPPGRLRLPGLDPARRYRLRPVEPGTPDPARTDPRVVPAWWSGGLEVPGSVLLGAGVQMPALDPEHLAVLHVEEVRA